MWGRWQRDATEFTVGPGCHERRGCQSTIPRPIVELPGLRDSITFKASGKKVAVLPG